MSRLLHAYHQIMQIMQIAQIADVYLLDLLRHRVSRCTSDTTATPTGNGTKISRDSTLAKAKVTDRCH